MHARAADRDLHGVFGGRLRRLLQLRSLRSGARGRLMSDQTVVSEREQRILGIIETARGKRAPLRDEQINKAHGAGGKATQTLIEGLFVPAFGGQVLAEMADAGGIDVDGVELALTTDSYVVK